MVKKKRGKKKVQINYFSTFLNVFPDVTISQWLSKFTIKKNLTYGQWLSDQMSKWAGSWAFITGFLIFLVIWMAINVRGWLGGWDPYPFILLNLVLSCLAAIQAPIILMSQNRAAQRDRSKAERDYMINRKAEKENQQILKDLAKIRKKLKVK